MYKVCIKVMVVLYRYHDVVIAGYWHWIPKFFSIFGCTIVVLCLRDAYTFQKGCLYLA